MAIERLRTADREPALYSRVQELIDAHNEGAKTQAELTSEGGSVTIPAGSTLDAALKIILDEIDP